MAEAGEIKILKLVMVLALAISAILITGCTDYRSDANNTDISDTQVQMPAKDHLITNHSKIFVPQSAEELLITNGSYVAETALKEVFFGHMPA